MEPVQRGQQPSYFPDIGSALGEFVSVIADIARAFFDGLFHLITPECPTPTFDDVAQRPHAPTPPGNRRYTWDVEKMKGLFDELSSLEALKVVLETKINGQMILPTEVRDVLQTFKKKDPVSAMVLAGVYCQKVELLNSVDIYQWEKLSFKTLYDSIFRLELEQIELAMQYQLLKSWHDQSLVILEDVYYHGQHYKDLKDTIEQTKWDMSVIMLGQVLPENISGTREKSHTRTRVWLIAQKMDPDHIGKILSKMAEIDKEEHEGNLKFNSFYAPKVEFQEPLEIFQTYLKKSTVDFSLVRLALERLLS